MNFAIAIISHERLNLFESKTLSFLKKHGICFEKVYVFVSDLSYLSYLPLSEKYGFNLLNSHNNLLKFNNNSILNARNNIINYFEEGSPWRFPLALGDLSRDELCCYRSVLRTQVVMTPDLGGPADIRKLDCVCVCLYRNSSKSCYLPLLGVWWHL